MIVIMAVILAFTGCAKEANTSEATKLSFKSSSSIDYLKSLNGQKVTIKGYLATSSPADGSFIFLMNLPYQSCPFCVPNTSQLVNTLEVYPQKGKSFGFTTQAVSVTGTLEFAKDKMFTDEYGYEFEYRLIDADYYILDDSELTDRLKVYNAIADSGVVNDLYQLYDYVYFTCAWPEYYCDSFTDADGNFVPGYYLWPADVTHFLENQYAYASDDFFDKLVKQIDSLNTDGSLNGMSKNVMKAKELAQDALAEMDKEAYSCEMKYLEQFQTEDYVYTLDDGQKLKSRYDILYMEFCDWINSYEL